MLLRWEHWASPTGDIREWLRHNTRVGAWLLMPAIGLILWQVDGWLSMLMTIFGHLIVLPVLILMTFVVIKIVTALIKR